jgi:putative nucleotidyltransferase with HDIG domain
MRPMEKIDVIAQIKQKDGLLSLPQALAEILREVDNPDFSPESLAKIILKDPSLTGRILKMANSSMYKRRAAISNVHQAVQVLGATTVKCLALSSSVFHPDQIKKEAGIDSQVYFANVLTVAAACEKIAQAMRYKASEDAFVAGLLHDIGTMFFIHHYPDQYRLIADRRVPRATTLMEAEQLVFGVDHCEAGYHLATRWRLPLQVAEAIRDHHADSDAKSANPVAEIVKLAALLTEDSTTGYGMGLEERLRAINQAAAALGLSKVEIDGVSVSLMSSTISVAEYLGVDIGNIEEMLTRANQEIWRTYLMIENLFKERQELSQKLLQQERARGAYESKTIAMATLSHYLNNAAMAISGRSQIVRMYLNKEDQGALMLQLPTSLDIIDNSIKKIVAVLAEMGEISPIDEVEFLSTSRAMNIDDRIKTRMQQMEKEPGVILPRKSELAVY